MMDSKWEGEIGVRDDSGREREIWGRAERKRIIGELGGREISPAPPLSGC